MAFIEKGHESEARAAVETCAREAGLHCLGWRTVPTVAAILGPRAASTLPLIRQCFFAPANAASDFERDLLLLRKRIEAVDAERIYFCSFLRARWSTKACCAPLQLREFYHGYRLARFSRFVRDFSPALFHEHAAYLDACAAVPVRGAQRRNQHDWRESQVDARARAAPCVTSLPLEIGFIRSKKTSAILPASITRWKFCCGAGTRPRARCCASSRPHGNRRSSSIPRCENFWQHEAREQEPWDGPAALVFSDGNLVGAKLDRNGLRPLRYTLTKNGLIVLGSEAGLADFAGEQIAERQRLGPGDILLADSAAGIVYRTNKVGPLIAASRIATGADSRSHGRRRAKPRPRQRQGLRRPRLSKSRSELQPPLAGARISFACYSSRSASKARKPSGAWATTLRRLSFHPRGGRFWDYCKQRFAQVTNPRDRSASRIARDVPQRLPRRERAVGFADPGCCARCERHWREATGERLPHRFHI